MKKVYRKPEMGIHVIEMARMIAISMDPNNNSKQEYGQDAKRRRGRGVFDDGEPEGSIW